MVGRRHARETLNIADREPRHFRAHKQLIVRGHAGRLMESADLNGDQTGPQLDLVEHARTAGRAEVARHGATGIPLRAIGANLASEREAVARHGETNMESAAARTLAITAVADKASDQHPSGFITHCAAQALPSRTSRSLKPVTTITSMLWVSARIDENLLHR